mmetsp:Transcript_9824/g.14464  ORF Transcript_9824/g.14464 Transcript_9824/m.14464 type:complete len:361 (-) Transcript_9824:482-1564(-)
MKAAVRKGLLGTCLSFVQDYTKPAFYPEKQKNDVLVKVHAAAINPVDYKLPGFVAGKVVGLDFCGTVEAVGSNVEKQQQHYSDTIRVGDLVYGQANQGSLAEYTTAPAKSIAKYKKKAPAATDDDNNNNNWKATELASLPVAYQSALQCLKKGNIIVGNNNNKEEEESQSSNNTTNNNKSVLVIGASGGCGMAGLQLCKSTPSVSRVVAICSGNNAQLVKDTGATEVVDYTNEKELTAFFQENVGKFDCVFDAATNSGGGEDYWKKSLPLLKDGNDGQYTSLNGSASKWTRAFWGKQKPRETLIICDQNTADLELIVEMLDKSGDRPLTQIMPFTEEGFEEAFQLLKSRRARGKIVLQIV